MTDVNRPPALELRSVTKTYGAVQAVVDLDLTVAAGELLSVIGPSGCGKSTTLRLIAGLEQPTAGELRIAGEVAAGSSWVPPERRRVGVVFQDHALFPHLDVLRNVAFGLHRLSSPARRARIVEVLDLVHLGHLAHRYPHELSGGEQQRVALARALAPRPAVIVLDEPFSSLDESLRARVRNETVKVLRETSTAAILVTHDQSEALSTGDRVAVMDAGRISQVGAPEDVFERPANRFVASFMGDADYLPVLVRNGVLSCEIGDVAPSALPVTPGRAEVVLRPHDVELTEAPGSAAVVIAVEYQGPVVLHTVRLSSGRTLRSRQSHTKKFPVGSEVSVTLAVGVTPTVLVDTET